MVDELPVSNLASSQHLALLPFNEEQPRMNSAGGECREGGSQEARGITNPPPKELGSTDVSGCRTCCANQGVCSAHKLFILLATLFFVVISPLSLLILAQCLLVMKPKINSWHSDSYSFLLIRIEYCLQKRFVLEIASPLLILSR